MADRAQTVKEVVVPVVRPVDVQPLGVDRPRRSSRLEQLGAPAAARLRAWAASQRSSVSGGAVVLDQAPDRSQRSRGTTNASRAGLWSQFHPPSGHCDRSSTSTRCSHALVPVPAKPAADRQRVAFHRGVSPLAARHDHERFCGRAIQSRTCSARPVRLEARPRHAELDQARRGASARLSTWSTDARRTRRRPAVRPAARRSSSGARRGLAPGSFPLDRAGRLAT